MRVAVYGASGYTGKLVAAEAHRRGLELVLAGRSAAKLRAVLDDLGLTGAQVRPAAVDDPPALAVVVGCGLTPRLATSLAPRREWCSVAAPSRCPATRPPAVRVAKDGLSSARGCRLRWDTCTSSTKVLIRSSPRPRNPLSSGTGRQCPSSVTVITARVRPSWLCARSTSRRIRPVSRPVNACSTQLLTASFTTRTRSSAHYPRHPGV